MLYFLGFVGYGVWPLAFVSLVPLSRRARGDAAPCAGPQRLWPASSSARPPTRGGYPWLWRLVDVFLGGDVRLGAALWLAHSLWFALGFALFGVALPRAPRARLADRRRGPAAAAGPRVALPAALPRASGRRPRRSHRPGPDRRSRRSAAAERARGPRERRALRDPALAPRRPAAARDGARGGALPGPRLRLRHGPHRGRLALPQRGAGAPRRRRAGQSRRAREAPRSRAPSSAATSSRRGSCWRRAPSTSWCGRRPSTAAASADRFPVSGLPIREELRGAAPLRRRHRAGRGREPREVQLGASRRRRRRDPRRATTRTCCVPFAEYLPLAALAGPLAAAFPHAQAFAAGTGTPALSLGPWRIATPICSESAEPALVRRMVARGAAAPLREPRERRLVRRLGGAVDPPRASRGCAQSSTAATSCTRRTAASARSSTRSAASWRGAGLLDRARTSSRSGADARRRGRSTGASATGRAGSRWRPSARRSAPGGDALPREVEARPRLRREVRPDDGTHRRARRSAATRSCRGCK